MDRFLVCPAATRDRDRALVWLLKDGGMRLSALLALRLGDIDWCKAVLTIRATKTRTARLVPVSALPTAYCLLLGKLPQHGCCGGMIPPFEPSTGLLPAGMHEATWEEFVARFGWTPHRLTLLAGLKAALDALRAAGCRRAYVDGSFVTAKPDPGDFDGCWETHGVDPAWLDPVLVTFDPYRRTQKAKYGGELFFADAPADPAGTAFIDCFQRDRSGHPKGIVALDLGALP